jgi:hypothetical protein
LGTAYLWEIVTLAGIPVARDMQMFFVSQKFLLWESFRHGELPLWTLHVGTGAPLLANFQSGVFYPPNWLLAILPFFLAFNLLVWLHFVIGGVSAALLARRLGLASVPAIIAAATWMLGGYFASLLNLMNGLQAAAWAPALALSLLHHIDRRSPVALTLLVIVAAMALLAGEPQTFLLATITAAVVGSLHMQRDPSSRRRPGRLLAGLVGGALLVTGLAMVQLLPTVELLGESARAAHGLSFREAAAFQLEPVRLIHLIVPTDYHDPEYSFGLRSIIGHEDHWLFSTYLGALFPLIFYFAWRNRARRRETLVWTVIGALGVLLALGDNTPLFSWAFDYLPGVSAFRFPEKYFFLTGFAAFIIAGFGAEGAIEQPPRRADALAAALLIGGIAAGRVLFALSRDTVQEWAAGFGNARTMENFDYVYAVWGGQLTKLLVLVSLAILIFWLRRRGTLALRGFSVLLAALVAVDLAVAHRDLNPVVGQEFYTTTPEIARHVPLAQVSRDYRFRGSRFDSLANTVPVVRNVPLEAQKWIWQNTLAPNTGQRWGTLQPDHWDAIKLRRFADERDLYRALPDPFRRWRLVQLHSVRYVYSSFTVDTGDYARQLELDSLPGHLYELRRPLPRAYVADDAVYVRDEVAAINEVLSRRFAPSHEVVLIDADSTAHREVDTGEPQRPDRPVDVVGGQTLPRVATIVENSPARIRVRLPEDPEGGFLVLTDSYYPGWQALVDGEEREIVLANFFFRAVAVSPGDREVLFRYRSRPLEWGRRISLLTAALGLALLTLGVRRTRRHRL